MIFHILIYHLKIKITGRNLHTHIMLFIIKFDNRSVHTSIKSNSKFDMSYICKMESSLMGMRS